MSEAKKVRAYQFDGTIESYNKIAKEIYPYSKKFMIIFCDENFDQCNCFCFGFQVFPIGIIYKPGDYVYLEISEEPPKEFAI